MHDERIWLVGHGGAQEDLSDVLSDAGVCVDEEPDLGASAPKPTVLLGGVDELAEARKRAPGALAIGLIAPADHLPQGLDAAVRGPVHPEALRVLIEALRHEGDDRRWAERVAVGAGARTWSRGPGRTTILDLSLAGCRLLHETPMRPGRRVSLWLPGLKASAWPRRVVGRVVRCESLDGCETDVHRISIAFTKVPIRSQQRLLNLLETHRGARLVPRCQSSSLFSNSTTAASEPVDSAERRRQRRQVYDRRVIAKRPEGPSVLIGRDLSVGGIKVEPTESLSLGSQLQVAVHGNPGSTPLVLDASVTRDDGADGLVLEFAALDERRQEYLEKLVSELDAATAPDESD